MRGVPFGANAMQEFAKQLQILASYGFPGSLFLFSSVFFFSSFCSHDILCSHRTTFDRDKLLPNWLARPRLSAKLPGESRCLKTAEPVRTSDRLFGGNICRGEAL